MGYLKYLYALIRLQLTYRDNIVMCQKNNKLCGIRPQLIHQNYKNQIVVNVSTQENSSIKQYISLLPDILKELVLSIISFVLREKHGLILINKNQFHSSNCKN